LQRLYAADVAAPEPFCSIYSVQFGLRAEIRPAWAPALGSC